MQRIRKETSFHYHGFSPIVYHALAVAHEICIGQPANESKNHRKSDKWSLGMKKKEKKMESGRPKFG